MMKHLFFAPAILVLTATAASAALPATCREPSTAYPNGILCVVSDFGAIADGSSHALSTRYGSLGAAQADYPFVTALTQQIDWAALQQTSNVALGALGSEKSRTNPTRNVPIYVPEGNYQLGSGTWDIEYAKGIRIDGASALATQIQSTGKPMRFYGLWDSEISNVIFARTGVSGTDSALDIDGLTGAGTIGVQGDTFRNITVDGGNNAYAVSVCLTGGGAGQCSEITFINPHFSGATAAVYYQNGSNAIDNVFNGGDLQNYAMDGIRLIGGSIKVLGTSFESTQGYTQIANSGCDIQASSAGAWDTVVDLGSRTESLCFYNGAFSQVADLSGISHIPVISDYAVRAYGSGEMVRGPGADLVTRAFRVTTAGTTTGTPTWCTTTGCTVTQNGVVFTEFDYNAVNIVNGGINLKTSHMDATAGVVNGVVANATGCGTSPVTSGNYQAGKVVEGSGATGCTVDIRFWPANAPISCAPIAANGVALSPHTALANVSGEIIWTLSWTHTGSPTTVSWVCAQ